MTCNEFIIAGHSIKNHVMLSLGGEMPKKIKLLFSALFAFSMLLSACAPDATPTAAPAAPAAPAATEPATAVPATEAPAAAPATEAPAVATPQAAAAGSAKPLNIAVVVKAVTSDYWKTVGVGVEQATKDDPTIKASFLGPNEETDIEGQIRIIEAQISSKVDGIAVAPSQADQLQPTLQKAVDAGIPVVLIDTDISGFTAKSAFVGTDNSLGGKLAGEFMAKNLQKGDEVAIIRGAAGDPVHNLRETSAKEAMEAAGLKVVDSQPADSDRSKGQSVAENILIKYPTLKGIYATNDEMALGAMNAAKTAGKTLVIVGFDASPDALKAIQAGTMSGSIAQFPSKIGELGVQTVAKIVRGEKVDSFVNTGVAVVSKDNLSEFLK
jgi:ribose transport system substrate-binding protein